MAFSYDTRDEFVFMTMLADQSARDFAWLDENKREKLSTIRDTYVFTARLANEVNRYNEVLDAMMRVIELRVKPTVEELNLLSEGLNGLIQSRRDSLEKLSFCKQINNAKRKNYANAKFIDEYRLKIELEIISFCRSIICLMDEKGDCYSHIAKLVTEEDQKVNAKCAEEAYESATIVAKGCVSPSDPIALGLALNFMVFYHEITGSVESAQEVAKKAYLGSLLHDVENEKFSISVHLRHLLAKKSNLLRFYLPKDGGRQKQNITDSMVEEE